MLFFQELCSAVPHPCQSITGGELSQTAGQCFWDESLVTALCWDLKECSPDAGSTEILVFSPSWRCAKGPSSGSIF